MLTSLPAAASIEQGDPDSFSMRSGRSVGLIHDPPGAGEVVEAVIREARAALAALDAR